METQDRTKRKQRISDGRPGRSLSLSCRPCSCHHCLHVAQDSACVGVRVKELRPVVQESHFFRDGLMSFEWLCPNTLGTLAEGKATLL